jgi:hypothetical protein
MRLVTDGRTIGQRYRKSKVPFRNCFTNTPKEYSFSYLLITCTKKISMGDH